MMPKNEFMTPSARVALLVLPMLLVVPGCGGGGGSGGSGGSDEKVFTGGVDDPVVPVRGTGGTYSMTPQEANRSGGKAGQAPPTFPAVVSDGQNHFIRLEFPTDLDPASVIDSGDSFAPFSGLNGNITITDQDGNHIQGIPTIGGIDAQGNDRSLETGWPEDLSASGRDRNLGANRFVYVATDRTKDQPGLELESLTAFGGHADDSDRDPATTDIKQIRITVREVNGQVVDAFWTINVGDHDATGPDVNKIRAEIPVADKPEIEGRDSVDTESSFFIKFNEPVVPMTVGLSSRFNPNEFKGNLPNFTWPTPPAPPYPHVNITAPMKGSGAGEPPLFVPFDVEPVNPNNLSKYRVTPLLSLPSNSQVQLIVRVQSSNQPTAAMDLRGNAIAVGADRIGDFQSGRGPAIVNAPVSPEVVYWTPSTGKGAGAIDLNGRGFNTNRPNAHDGSDLSRTAIITSNFNLRVQGRARDGSNNNYVYPVGTGSPALAYQHNNGDPGFPGNPGTPVPGINEMSDGFETLVRDSDGGTNLTGGSDGLVGHVTEMSLGESLDTVIFDTLNPWAQNAGARTSLLNGGGLDRNTLADPPTPNPPPLRYAVGMQPLSFILDTTPGEPVTRVIEGEEVFGSGGGVDGFGTLATVSRTMLHTNDTDPLFGFDEMPTPFFMNGPPPQSATTLNLSGWSARQQIGNFLYVADQTNNEVKVLNSNNMRVLASLPLPDPYGLAIAPHKKQLYVTNFGDDTVSVISTDPFTDNFHQEINRISVGNGPRAISVQPDFEDILVCNWSGNSIDIIDPGRGIVRKSVDALVSRPFDIVTSERQVASGFGAGVYFSYISNFAGNNVLVFESGPDGTNGIGLDNILGNVPNDSNQGPDFELVEPRGMVYDSGINSQSVYAGGAYVAHKDTDGRGLVSRIQFTWQAQYGPILRNPPPGYFQPPGFSDRRFEITGQWGHLAGGRLAGNAPTSLALSDLNTRQYRDAAGPLANGSKLPAPVGIGANNGVTDSKHPMRVIGGLVPANFPDRLYVAFEDADAIQVLDPLSGGTVLKTIEGVGSVSGLYTFWSQ